MTQSVAIADSLKCDITHEELVAAMERARQMRAESVAGMTKNIARRIGAFFRSPPRGEATPPRDTAASPAA